MRRDPGFGAPGSWGYRVLGVLGFGCVGVLGFRHSGFRVGGCSCWRLGAKLKHVRVCGMCLSAFYDCLCCINSWIVWDPGFGLRIGGGAIILALGFWWWLRVWSCSRRVLSQGRRNLQFVESRGRMQTCQA